ncbi:substrate-binding periplasmic protein [Gimibacter soli]|uniref:Transporter substrate-binding domain-containing protein n=1 Tax=Gimibacter soli TaxID=3024400 RepID=A0AAE9XUA9_9PROT|nr:transporter substrate-binding domain-containing protein [Gimibacter soli]WCL53658.1 transporter substrate-binding domain-containing protein [Gimibacter soli]
MIRAFGVSLCLLMSVAAKADDAPPIAVPYYEYPPKMVIVNGVPTGSYIDTWKAIAERAGVQLEWMPSSISEETAMLDRGTRPMCNTGRLMTEERRKTWVFLPYVYDWLAEDVIVTSPAFRQRIAAHPHLRDLLTDTSLHPTFVGGLAIGEGVEGAKANRSHWRDLDVKSEAQAVRMVGAGRADYTLSNADQFAEAVRDDPALGKLVTLRLPGMYPRTPVSIACTRGTPPALIEAIGKAMQELGYVPAP